MDDARRYRWNAAECLSAATRCQEERSLLLSISAGWHALARHDEAMRDLLAGWGVATPAHQVGKNADDRSRQGASNARDQDRKARRWDLGLACGSLSLITVLLIGERHKPLVSACGWIDE
jgi:hypothetical protein